MQRFSSVSLGYDLKACKGSISELHVRMFMAMLPSCDPVGCFGLVRLWSRICPPEGKSPIIARIITWENLVLATEIYIYMVGIGQLPAADMLNLLSILPSGPHGSTVKWFWSFGRIES